MSRGNDAIPSWSGFNYQGKMMLLCAIEKMNSLINDGKDISSYDVELEKTEDYAFLESGKYISCYQVKASISLYKWYQYDEALGKLLHHRNTSNNPAAKCFFVVARELSDWSDAGNPYKSSIELYKYGGNIVDLKDVKKNIINEIEKLLTQRGCTAINIDAVYGALCVFLDNKISSMHKQKYAKRKYTISFSEILHVVLGSVDKQEEDAAYVLREKVFEHMVDTIYASIEDICDAKCGIHFAKCSKTCAAKCAVESIYEMSSIRDYCKVINPEKNCDWDKQLEFVENFTKDQVKKYILTVFAKSENPKLVVAKGNKVGIVSNLNPLKKGMIIPTLLKFEDTFRKIEDSMQFKLQRMKDNRDIIHELYGNSIIVDSTDGMRNVTLSQAQITSAWDGMINQDSIESIENDIGFVSYSELLCEFEDKGGNYE